jgi:hypothetical protein
MAGTITATTVMTASTAAQRDTLEFQIDITDLADDEDESRTLDAAGFTIGGGCNEAVSAVRIPCRRSGRPRN